MGQESACNEADTGLIPGSERAPGGGHGKQEYWSGLPFPSPGDLPDLGIKLGFPALQADSLPSEPPGQSNLMARGVVLREYLWMDWKKKGQTRKKKKTHNL